MNTNYKLKYLKYKNKYIKFKNYILNGGAYFSLLDINKEQLIKIYLEIGRLNEILKTHNDVTLSDIVFKFIYNCGLIINKINDIHNDAIINEFIIEGKNIIEQIKQKLVQYNNTSVKIKDIPEYKDIEYEDTSEYEDEFTTANSEEKEPDYLPRHGSYR